MVALDRSGSFECPRLVALINGWEFGVKSYLVQPLVCSRPRKRPRLWLVTSQSDSGMPDVGLHEYLIKEPVWERVTSFFDDQIQQWTQSPEVTYCDLRFVITTLNTENATHAIYLNALRSFVSSHRYTASHNLRKVGGVNHISILDTRL